MKLTEELSNRLFSYGIGVCIGVLIGVQVGRAIYYEDPKKTAAVMDSYADSAERRVEKAYAELLITCDNLAAVKTVNAAIEMHKQRAVDECRLSLFRFDASRR